MCKILSYDIIAIWVVLLWIVDVTQTTSYNQPKFCPFSSWNPNAITLLNSSLIGSNSYSSFVNNNNTIFVYNRNSKLIQLWTEESVIPMKNISSNSYDSHSLFVTNHEDIYIDNSTNGQVDKWLVNATSSIVALYVKGSCYGLFVDFNYTLYCSIMTGHQVVKNFFDSGPNISIICAGNGTSGSALDMLSSPGGIFVDINFNLYVADAGNNRIQLFRSGELNGTTVATNGTMGIITLNQPLGVVLDADGYLFIEDHGNNRIIGSSSTGFRCIVGCSGHGSTSNKLTYPTSLYFDTHGNLIVNDWYNSRIQKFLLTTNSCVLSNNRPKFSSCASWNSNAITFANVSAIGTSPFGIFVDAGNTLYINDRQAKVVRLWTYGSIDSTRTLAGSLTNPRGIFVTTNGDTYVDRGNGIVDRWSSTATTSEIAVKFIDSCFSIFVDLNNTLYCAMGFQHHISKTSLNNNTNVTSIAAGTNINGSAPDMLNFPCGIFVDTNFDLYVADTNNHRIQLFRSGELNATTIVGNGAPNTTTLNQPHAIVLDGDGYLFIIELGNHRLTISRPNGFQCLAGCNNMSGSASNEFFSPVELALDSYGSIYVTDRDNRRIQKFDLATNICNETTTVQQITTSTIITEISTIISITSHTNDFNQTDSTSSLFTSSLTAITSKSSFFIPPFCTNSTFVGPACNISIVPCDMLTPCKNNGTCQNPNTTLLDYICLCPPNYNGTECQFDYRPCKENTCWNNGICETTLNKTFNCTCRSGWEGVQCETKINYCKNITCQNKGICRPLLRDFKCECLNGSYSGDYCEIIAKKTMISTILSKSLAFIAITVIISTVMFIIIMDLLKYCFGIDVTFEENRRKKTNKRPIKRSTRVSRNMSSSLIEARI